MATGKTASVARLADDVALRKARKACGAAVEQLIEWTKSEDPRTSLAAIAALLDRVYGKPAAGGLDDETGKGPITEIVRTIVDPKG